MDLSQYGIGTTSNVVNELKRKTVKVFETPSTIFCPLTSELIEDGFHTITNANGKIHGKVTKSGSVLQMSDLIDIAYNVDLQNNLGLNFNDANVNYYKDESICTLNVPMGISSFKNSQGMVDDTEIFLFVKTGFGGTTATEVGIYSHRFVCSNGMEVRKGLNYFKAKHTERMNELAKVFLSTSLPKMMTSVNDFTQQAQKLDKATITKEQIEAFRQTFFGYKKGDNLSTKKLNQVEQFNFALNEEMDRAGQTAWGLLQGATNYTNHRHFNASKEFIVTGSGATLNANAEKMVLELI